MYNDHLRQHHGNFWFSDAPYKMKRLCFFSQVASAAISAGHSFVFTVAQSGKLDVQVVKLMRAMMRGEAYQRDPSGGKGKALTNEQVQRYWRIAPCHLEIRIRRLKMMQRHLREPKRHVQMNACMFGTFVFECAQINLRGTPTEFAHPWLVQFYKDVEYLHCIDEGASLLEYIHDRCNLWTLIRDKEAVDMSCSIDMTQLRNVFFSVRIPPPGYGPPPGLDPPSSNGAEVEANTFEFKCNLRVGEGVCGAGFTTHRALISHMVHTKNETHGIRKFARFITRTNQCVHCRSVFNSREAAQNHTAEAERRGVCPTSRSKRDEG